jgi:hypothetical protein
MARKKRVRKNRSPIKPALGRPPAEFTDEQIKLIDEHALHNCKDNQIATLMGIDQNTFKTHFGKRCIEKRAQGQAEKLKQQYQDKTPTMLIWWGKQHLGQTDKQQLAVNVNNLADIVALMGIESGE